MSEQHLYFQPFVSEEWQADTQCSRGSDRITWEGEAHADSEKHISELILINMEF